MAVWRNRFDMLRGSRNVPCVATARASQMASSANTMVYARRLYLRPLRRACSMSDTSAAD
ncbi:MAG: hypothetical protein BWY85_02288 [Firmicutes bacterium ADurb.Bin506]|nr:MAG: hypothetical protein BWY85_02288 [Firmicutes bacterium ADurb.Bin506]